MADEGPGSSPRPSSFAPYGEISNQGRGCQGIGISEPLAPACAGSVNTSVAHGAHFHVVLGEIQRVCAVPPTEILLKTEKITRLLEGIGDGTSP